MTTHTIDTIVSDPSLRNGHLLIAGTQVRVIDVIASYLYRGLIAEELAVNFGLDMGQVHAALAYYYQHRDELVKQLNAEAAEAEQRLAELAMKGKLIRVE